MIDVDSREVRLQLLWQILQFIETGQAEFLAALGRPATEQQRMRTLTNRQVLDPADRQAAAEYFIRHGASEAQLREYTNIGCKLL